MDENKNAPLKMISPHCKEVRFASFISGGFITAILVNPPERKQANTPLCIVWEIGGKVKNF